MQLITQEIRQYLGLLEVASALYRNKQLDEVYFSIHKDSIRHAAYVVEQLPKSMDTYPNILALKDKTLQTEERPETQEGVFRNIDDYMIPIGISIFTLMLFCVVCRMSYVSKAPGHLTPVESGDAKCYIVTVAEATAKQASKE